MRITESEKIIIKATAKDIFCPCARIFLFGSRVNDRLKGGDIKPWV